MSEQTDLLMKWLTVDLIRLFVLCYVKSAFWGKVEGFRKNSGPLLSRRCKYSNLLLLNRGSI